MARLRYRCSILLRQQPFPIRFVQNKATVQPWNLTSKKFEPKGKLPAIYFAKRMATCKRSRSDKFFICIVIDYFYVTLPCSLIKILLHIAFGT